MPGTKGKVTRAKTKGRRTIYLSNVLGVWSEGKHLHITMQKGEQLFHTSITAKDGLLYDVLSMLYHHGIALNP
jgi:hypothetical protein